ncbi:PEP-CTERM sorting domain-containing protein [Falsiroseomonas oryzae]|uniref:PEP-CTERM sorting domain-containing protein n=1 Tax=Falsiroseomonas oryzae TaxID=2766473 RepID=UPI0022EB7889|nr:PEP-CTERM sorting domain-containing protein [Roseomonas sp. MO-31]
MTLRTAAAALLLLLAPAPAALAGPIACTGALAVLAGRVEGATNCLVDRANTNDTKGVVNAGTGYFGHTDWTLLGKLEDGGDEGGYDFASKGFASARDADMFMLVFKSGRESLVAYLVDAQAGEWETPFIRPAFPGAPRDGRDVSHVSHYARVSALPPPLDDTDSFVVAPPPAIVPEPGTLALFSLAALGLNALRRARRRA